VERKIWQPCTRLFCCNFIARRKMYMYVHLTKKESYVYWALADDWHKVHLVLLPVRRSLVRIHTHRVTRLGEFGGIFYYRSSQIFIIFFPQYYM
jgi:hypothetical protein